MAATIADVARLAGCSITTVSRVYTAPSKVRKQTRENVYAAAKALDYSPNAIARAMVLQKNQNIAFILGEKHYPVTLNPFYAAISEAAQMEAEHLGYHMYAASLPAIADPSGLLMRKRMDGAIFAGETDTVLLHRLHEQGLPIVLVNNFAELRGVLSITSDDYLGATQAMEHLIERGHTRIGLIAGNLFPYIVSTRYRAYLETLARHGLGVNPAFTCTVEPRQEDALAAVSELLARPERPSALFCMNDQIAVGAVKAALRRGLRVPEDLAVVGYDDSTVCTIIEPELTSVHVSTRQMGQLAMRHLVEIIGGKKQEQSHLVLAPSLVVRGST